MGTYDLTVGVLLIGIFVNTYLYGLVTYQFLIYYHTKFTDSWWIRSTVFSLFVIDTVHSIVGLYAGWIQCVTHYAEPETLLFVNWTVPFTASATAVAAFITQLFLGYRVLLLTKSKILIGIIYTLGIVGCVFGIVAGVMSGIIAEVAKFDPLAPYVICWLSFQTGADLLITFSLSAVLAKSKTGFKKTDTMINTLIRGAIQTGLFASIFAMGDLISFLAYRDTNMYMFFALPIGRIYTNTLLHTLNTRSELKNMSSTMIDMDTESNAFRMQSHTLHSVNVHKEVVTDAGDSRSVDSKFAGRDPVYTGPA